MDFASMALIIAALAFFITSFGVVIEYKSIVISRGIQKWLMHESEAASMEREEQGNIGDQLEEWMLRETKTEDGRVIDNLSALTARIGHGFAASMRGASMQENSVESRITNQYSKKIQEAVKQQIPVGYKFLFEIAKRLGFDLEEIMEKGELTEFYNAAKANRLDLLFANNGAVSSSGGGNIPRA